MNEYIYVKLLPTTGTNNDKTDGIAKKVNLLYKKANKKKGDKKLITKQSKMAYYIYSSKSLISFYMIIPKDFLSEFQTICENTWKGINLEVVDELPGNFDMHYTQTNVSTRYSDALSLRTDKRDNYLLASTISVSNVLKENENVGILYNFVPTSAITRKNDRATFREDIKKAQKNYSLEKNKTIKSGLKNLGITAVEYVGEVIEDTTKDLGLNMKVSKANTEEVFTRELDKDTKDKLKAEYIHTQILILSNSPEGIEREKELNEYVADNFDKIEKDNEFIYKHRRVYSKKKKDQPFNFNEFKYGGVPVNVFSQDECQHFISLPGKTIMNEFKQIENIPYKQLQVPEYATKGYKLAGIANNRSKLSEIYFSNETRDMGTTGIYMFGPPGSGKSTYMKRYICDCLAHKDIIVAFDYLGSNEFATDLDLLLPDNYKHIIDLSDYLTDKAQALALNEIDIKHIKRENYKSEKLYREAYLECLSDYAEQIVNIFSCINGSGVGASLSPRMEKFLRVGSIINYSKPNQTIMSLYKVMTDHIYRHKLINELPDFVKSEDEYGAEIKEFLDNVDMITYEKDPITGRNKIVNGSPVEVVTGTQESAITFFLDRFNSFKSNRKLKKLATISPENNIDFTDLFLKSEQKVVIIKIPDDAFSGISRDIVCNFYANKIILAMKKRRVIYNQLHPEDRMKAENMTMAHVIFDESYLLKGTMMLIKEYLTQFRKFRVCPILTGHYIDQLDKEVADSICNSFFNFVISGPIDKAQYVKLSNNFKDLDYEQCENLAKRHAMVSLNYLDGRKSFVVKMPGDVVKEGHPIFKNKKVKK